MFTKLRRRVRPAVEDFSGWHWAPKTLSRPTNETNGAPYSPVPSTMSSSGGHRDVGVHVVEGRALAEVGDERRRAPPGHDVPADVRQLQPARVEPHDLAGQQPEAGRPAVLGGALEEQLHPEAQPDHRHARRRALAHELVQAGRAQSPHRLRERADAGHDEAVGRGEDVVVGGEARARRRRARWPSRPSGGCPCRSRRSRSRRSGSPSWTGRRSPSDRCVTATRRARANALNAASMRWWAFVPVSSVMCSVSRAVLGDGAHELLGQLVLEPSGDAGRDRDALPHEQRAARRCPARTTPAPRPSGRRRGRSG